MINRHKNTPTLCGKFVERSTIFGVSPHRLLAKSTVKEWVPSWKSYATFHP